MIAFSILLILLVTLAAGAYPFIKKMRSTQKLDFPIGESLASGVFLGAGLIHMLGDSAQGFINAHYNYPFAFLIAGASFLFLLLLEHIGREMYEHDGAQSSAFAVLTLIMLSLHSFLAGAALGFSSTFSVFLVILLAILAHKWAASFALAVQLNKSQLAMKTSVMLFLVFALMVPLGILFAHAVTHDLHDIPLLQPIFSALAAGTFLYLGTLHGLKRAVMVEKCCNLSRFKYVIIGFAIMAVVAIWT
jgi:solute carrier family 39 (zinc transporter), member 1/2/3